MRTKIGLNQEFRPSPRLKGLYYVDAALVIIFGFLSWMVPVFVLAPPFVSFIIAAPILAAIIIALYWIPKYYDTITYRLTSTEITWRRGVWFKMTGIVPYNRITNIDISQGPISRKFGIASLKIQTAGYSAPSGRSAEIHLDGISDPETLREGIMRFVRGSKPVAVESYESEDFSVLKELIKIRKLLEKRRT